MVQLGELIPIKQLHRRQYAARRHAYRALRKACAILSVRWQAAQERKALVKLREIDQPQDDIDDAPLITVAIGTYNRAQLLVNLALPSVLAQSYKNFEIIVVGDCCTDNTEDLLTRIGDSRIRFYNLPTRPPYPDNPKYFWMAGGAYAFNRAMDEARGKWIAHLDDDEYLVPDHLEFMLQQANARKLEMLYGEKRQEVAPGEWVISGGPEPFVKGLRMPVMAHSSLFFRSYLRCFPYDINSWKLNLAGDHHRELRMFYAGVRTGFVDRVCFHAPLRPNTTKPNYFAEDFVKN